MHRMNVLAALAGAGVVAASGEAGAQQARLAIAPARPTAGALVRLTVTDSAARDTIVAVGGTMAGEPLHFRRASRRVWSALGGVPVDSLPAPAVEVIARRVSGRADTLHRVVVPAPLPPPSEQLAVAPRFGEPLDSATEARVAAEGARAREIGRRSHETPRMWTAPFIAPRPSAITSRFGTGRLFNGRVTSRHLGVDYRGAAGEPVRASNRGVVVLVDTFYLGGRLVYVDHGEGVMTAYMHLTRALVRVGDTVARGERVGLVGATGRVTGPHLHWAARYGTLTVNPLGLLTAPSPPPRAPRGSGARPPRGRRSGARR